MFQFQKLILLLLLSASFSSSFSQFNYGVRAGAQYTGDGFWIHGGIFSTHKLNSYFSLEGDLLYTEKGSIYDWYGMGKTHKYTLRSVNVPVLIHFNTSNRTSIFLGAEPGFLLSAHYRTPDDYGRIESKDLRWFDLGLSGGLNYKITPHIQVMARYVHGLRSTWSASDPWVDSGNNLFQLSVGYTLHKDTTRSAFAKPERGARWFIGLSQGFSKSSLEHEFHSFGDDHTQYTAGIDIRLEYGRYFYVSSGINYMQRGGDIGSQQIRLNYLSIPVVFGFSPVKTKPLTLSMEVGIATERLLSSRNGLIKGNKQDWDIDYENTSMNSYIYGFEISTDAVDRLNIFLNHRVFSPYRGFFYGSPKDSYEEYDLSSGGWTLSLGARIKL